MGTPRQQHTGFTIIEVLIVLAIAGFILMVVFIAVPNLSRAGRNHTRKEAVNYIAAQLNLYYGNRGHYPLYGTAATQDDRTSFVNELRARGSSKLFAIRYTDERSPHEYPYNLADPTTAMDEISIEPSHNCNRNSPGAGSIDYPLISTSSTDTDFHSYAVWTIMEVGNGTSFAYCIDNARN